MAKWADGMFADGWRDIESAPKDGTDILVVESHGEMWVVRWIGWCESWNAYDQKIDPTHWLPLPEPPK